MICRTTIIIKLCAKSLSISWMEKKKELISNVIFVQRKAMGSSYCLDCLVKLHNYLHYFWRRMANRFLAKMGMIIIARLWVQSLQILWGYKISRLVNDPCRLFKWRQSHFMGGVKWLTSKMVHFIVADVN